MPARKKPVTLSGFVGKVGPVRFFILLFVLFSFSTPTLVLGASTVPDVSWREPDSLGCTATPAELHHRLPAQRTPVDLTVPGWLEGRARGPAPGHKPFLTNANGGGEVGPPFQIGAETTYGPVPWDQRSVAVAYGAGVYFVVWSDARNSIEYAVSDLYGARVSPSGEVLDPCGIAISGAVGSQRWPSVAFDGNNFVVVWEDSRNYGFDIYCARVSPEGNVLDPGAAAVCAATGNQLRPAIAFDGVNYLVAWEDWRSGSLDLYGTRLDQALNVLDVGGIPISTSVGDQYYPEVAFCSGKYLVVWQDFRSDTDWDVYGARVDASGTVLDPDGIPVLSGFSHQWVPDVASDGLGFMVVWADGRATGTDVHSDIYGARVDTSGTVQDSGGFTVSSAAYMQHWPAVVYDGAQYVVAWEDKRNGLCDIYACRLASSGVVLDPAGILVSSAEDEQYYPAVASDGSTCLAVWDDHRYLTDWNTFGSPLTSSATPLEPEGILISSLPNQHYFPGVAFGGTNYLVVWYDTRKGDSDIHAARVDLLGNLLDVNSIPVSTAPGDQCLPHVAFDGTDYLVVWEDFRSLTTWDIYGARVDTAGVVLDPGGIPISTAPSHQFCPSVAFDGANCMVVWADARASGSDQFCDVYGARVNTAGTVLDGGGIAIAVAPGMQHWPKLAFDGTNYTVVWQDTRNGDYDIYGARVTAAGVVLDTDGIPISTVAQESYMPAIAFDGTDYLVVWEDDRSGVDFGIYGTKLTPAGQVLNPGGITVSDEDYHQLEPCIAYDGNVYAVAWQDLRNSLDYRVYATRVTTSGAVLDPAGVPISGGLGHETNPAIASAASGQFLLAYSSYLLLSGGCDSYRIFGNTWNAVSEGPEYVGYWAFDEGVGSTAVDSAFANNGVVYNATWVEGVRGKALLFNGLTSYVRIPNLGPYDLAGAGSVEAWVRMSPSQTYAVPQVVDKSHRATVEPPQYSGYALCGSVYEDYSLGFVACDGSSCVESNSGVALNDGAWHFLAGTFSTKEAALRFYLDGKLATETPFEGPVETNSGDLFIGRWWYGGGYFSGVIDEVKIFDVALSADEIAEHFEAGYSGIEERRPPLATPAEKVFLAQNVPNPFNPVTSISFYLADPSDIQVSVFDTSGNLISEVGRGPASSGWHTLTWSAGNLPSGIYFVRLDAGVTTKVCKAVLLK